jgi:threonine-phosphate decarboxylase
VNNQKSSHGGDIYSFAKELNLKPKNVIDFSSNINQYSPKIGSLSKDLDISKYADFRYEKLKKKLAKKYKTVYTQIALFSGASRAIVSFLSLFENLNEKIVLYAPIYGEYRRFSKKTVLINRFTNIYQDPPKNSLVIFVNPSTPDGKAYDMRRLFGIWKRNNNKILIDESFLEFTNEKSSIEELKNSNKLYILKSLTKFYACAGVRLGIIISSKKNIKELQSHTSAMWDISTFDEKYILKALKDKNFPKKAIQKTNRDKKELLKVLQNSPYIEKIYPSDINFFLVKLKNIDAFALQEICKKENILIRNCKNFDFLDHYHVRLAVRKREDIRRLEKVLCA